MRSTFRFPKGIATAMFAAALVLSLSARASSLNVLHSFCTRDGCRDGQAPALASLASDTAGNLYGVTAGGGHKGHGVVFELLRGTAGSPWKYKLLYKFCTGQLSKCPDGSMPGGGLILDSAGNLYGTTTIGGASDGGVVYELSPPTARSPRWAEKVLYDFCSQHDCTDGRWAVARLTYAGAETGVPYDGTSALYGITLFGGGGSADGGVVFSLTPGGGTWSEHVLHVFCSENGCADGGYPNGNLLIDASGNLYGTTTDRGPHSGGTIFELSGSSFQVLYSFCTQAKCADGSTPYAGLIADAAGNLYGTTQRGGSGCNGSGCGTIYRLVPNGAQSQYSVLYRFCQQANCADGQVTDSDLALGPSGNLYGTTFGGGIDGKNFGNGVIFEWNGASLQVLYEFCANNHCTDGSGPQAGVILDPSGNLFGTTNNGGAHAGGEVYEFTP